MKLRKLTAVLLAGSICLTGGCAGFNASLESLLSPPKLTRQQAEIYQALLNVKGSDVDLVYPKSGDYRSAFTIFNLDDEPTEEAMVFYREDSDVDSSTSLRLNFLDLQEDKWVSVLDMPADGNEVERIQLERLSGKDNLCIIVSYSVLGQQETGLDIMTFRDGKVTELYRDSYTYLDVKDFNADGQKELLLIKRETGLNYFIAQLTAWLGNTVAAVSSVPLEAQAISFLQTAVSAIAKNETAVMIDYGRGDNSYGTEVLFCYNTSLSNSNFSADMLSRRTNSYTPNLLCRDADGDGKTEIPTTTPFPGYENTGRSEQVNMIVWYELNGKSLRKDFSSYWGVKDDFMIKLPGRWVGMVTAKVSGDEIRFIENTQDGETLLIFKAASPEAKVTEGWELYYENERTGYQYFIIRGSTDNSMCLTDAELEDCLVFFE